MKLTHKILSSSVLAFGVLGMLALAPTAQAHDSYAVVKKTFAHTPHGKKLVKKEIVHKPIHRKHVHKKIKHDDIKHDEHHDNKHVAHNGHNHDPHIVKARHSRHGARGHNKFRNRGYSRGRSYNNHRGFRNNSRFRSRGHHRSRGYSSGVAVKIHPSFVFKF